MLLTSTLHSEWLPPTRGHGILLHLPTWLPLIGVLDLIGVEFLTVWLRHRSKAKQEARIDAAVRDALSGSGTAVASPASAEEDELEVH